MELQLCPCCGKPKKPNFSGHRYGLQALKPAFEFIAVAQVPYSGRPVDSIVETGAGSLNIDGGRIPTGDNYHYDKKGGNNGNVSWSGLNVEIEADSNPLGRWPANFLLQHTSIPIMKLTGNLPDGIIIEIRRYFDDYDYMSKLRDRGTNNQIQSRFGSEVLQQQVQILDGNETKDTDKGNPEVPILREGIYDTPVLGERGPAEILQSDLLSKLPKDTSGGNVSTLRETSFGRNERKNISGTDRTSRKYENGESSKMEGRGIKKERRVRKYNDRDIARESKGFSISNDASQEIGEVKIHIGTSLSDGSIVGQTIEKSRNSSPYQWNKRRQSAGKLSNSGTDSSFFTTSESRDGISKFEEGSSGIEVLACDIPEEWSEYFEYTGRDLTCTDSACVDQCPVAMLDRQSGESESHPSGYNWESGDNGNPTHVTKNIKSGIHYGDSGPASRMFYRADWNYETAERLANADPIKYQPKPSTTEREAGLEGLPTKTRRRVNSGGFENEPRFAPTQVRNNHPTLKSISLNKYLSTLLLSPDAYAPRRILVPFSGAGSEMVGCVLAGFEEVIGIEQSAAYCQIASKRLEWWSRWPGWGQTDVDTILSTVSDEDSRQGRLF